LEEHGDILSGLKGEKTKAPPGGGYYARSPVGSGGIDSGRNRFEEPPRNPLSIE
jgi:hypothetical protein